MYVCMCMDPRTDITDSVARCQCILLDKDLVQQCSVSEAEHYFTYPIFFVLVKGQKIALKLKPMLDSLIL